MSPDNFAISMDEYKRMERYISFLRLMKLRGRTDVSLDTLSEELGLERELVDDDFHQFGLSLAGQFTYNIKKLTTEVE